MVLKVGTVVQIEKKYTEEDSKFRSKIVDTGNHFLMIDYPTHIQTGKTAYFMDGTELSITFTDDTKMSYVFHAEVQGRVLKGIPMLRIGYEGDESLVKIQRREYVRVPAKIDVAVKTEEETFQLVTEDLSAGGIALTIPEAPSFREGDTVSFLIVLPFLRREIMYVRALGKMIRIREKENEKIASFEFADISPADRQLIIQFCFERQLQTKNK